MVLTSDKVVGDACVLVVSVCVCAGSLCEVSGRFTPYVSKQMAQALGSSIFTAVAVIFVDTKM